MNIKYSHPVPTSVPPRDFKIIPIGRRVNWRHVRLSRTSKGQIMVKEECESWRSLTVRWAGPFGLLSLSQAESVLCGFSKAVTGQLRTVTWGKRAV